MQKPQTLSPPAATDTTNQQEYSLTLIKKIGNYSDYTEHEMYSISLGNLTPEDAKLVEEYGQSFKWADVTLSPAMKEELVARLAERVIFTPLEKDAVDIELNGCCNDASLRSVWLIAHTNEVRKRIRISIANRHFNDQEEKGSIRRKLTRYIMKLCVKKAEELRNASKPIVPDEVVPATSTQPQSEAALAELVTAMVAAVKRLQKNTTQKNKPKASNEKNGLAGNVLLIVMELIRHHRLRDATRRDATLINREPHSVTGIAKNIAKGKSVVSDFFAKYFRDPDGTKGHAVYTKWCRKRWDAVVPTLLGLVESASRERSTDDVEINREPGRLVREHSNQIAKVDAELDKA